MTHAGIDDGGERRLRLALIGVLLVIVIGGTVDLALDAPRGRWSSHLIYELLLTVAALVMTAALWARWTRAERSLAHVRRTLGEREAERDDWRRSAERALRGLGDAIDAQLARWGLTPAERGVALRLLQGQSHKAIAYATGRSERTVRQHAVAVYEKSGLGGRAELAAFFLGGLLPSPADAQAIASDPVDAS